MSETDSTTSSTLPPDDESRGGVLVNVNSPGIDHIALMGDNYSVLVSGKDSNGRYTSIDMIIPPNGGPPLHRHDFEEMFTVLEGQIEVTLRGQQSTARAGDTVNVPANAPHRFTNAQSEPAHLLCVCAPAGQEEWFAVIGDHLPNHNALPPQYTEAEQQERIARMVELAPQYKTEFFLDQ